VLIIWKKMQICFSAGSSLYIALNLFPSQKLTRLLTLLGSTVFWSFINIRIEPLFKTIHFQWNCYYDARDTHTHTHPHCFQRDCFYHSNLSLDFTLSSVHICGQLTNAHSTISTLWTHAYIHTYQKADHDTMASVIL